MKRFGLTVVLALMFVASLAVVRAQDTQEVTVPDGLVGSMTIAAEAGTLADDVITLTGTDELASYFISAPSLNAGFYSMSEFTADWSVESAAVSAVLVLEDRVVYGSATLVGYDITSGEFSFSFAVSEVVGEEISAKTPIAAEFGTARLMLQLDTELLQALVDASVAREDGTRAGRGKKQTGVPCRVNC